jgi:hypothetical protein
VAMYHFKSNDEIIIQASHEMKGGKRFTAFDLLIKDVMLPRRKEQRKENFHLFTGFLKDCKMIKRKGRKGGINQVK